MKKIKVWIGLDLVGCTREIVIEIDEDELADMSTDEIEELAKEAAFEFVEWGYEVEA